MTIAPANSNSPVKNACPATSNSRAQNDDSHAWNDRSQTTMAPILMGPTNVHSHVNCNSHVKNISLTIKHSCVNADSCTQNDASSKQAIHLIGFIRVISYFKFIPRACGGLCLVHIYCRLMQPLRNTYYYTDIHNVIHTFSRLSLHYTTAHKSVSRSNSVDITISTFLGKYLNRSSH